MLPKLSLYVLVVLSCAALSLAALSDGVINQQKLDATSGTTSPDSLNLHNATLNNLVYEANGKINHSWNSTNAQNSNITITGLQAFNASSNFTICLWEKPGTWTDGRGILSYGTRQVNNEFMVTFQTKVSSGNKINFRVWKENVNLNDAIAPTVISVAWHQFCMVYFSNQTYKGYVDGVNVVNQTFTFASGTVANTGTVTLSNEGYSADYNSGSFDEFFVANRSFSDAEISSVYGNESAGKQYPWSSSPSHDITVTADSPADNLHTNGPINISANLTTNYEANCTLTFNGSNNQSVKANTSTINYTANLSDGTYSYNVSCNDGTVTNTSGNRTIVWDRVAPSWTIRSLATDNSSLKWNGRLYQFNDTASDANLYAVNVTITNSTGGVKYTFQNASISGTTYTVNNSVNMSAWPSGNYTVTFEADDSHTATKINDYANVVNLSSASITYNTDTGTNVRLVGIQKNGTITGLTTWKDNDRYRWQFNWSNTQTHQVLFNVTSTNAPIIDLSGRYALPDFVIGKYWLDFNLSIPFNYTVQKSGNGYLVWISASGNSWTFSSIGGLNVRVENYTFQLFGTGEKPPSVPTVNLPMNQTYPLTFTASATGSAAQGEGNSITAYRYVAKYVNGSVFYNSTSAANVTITATAPGQAYVLESAIDAFGQESAPATSPTLTLLEPNITITLDSPVNGLVVTDRDNITFNGSIITYYAATCLLLQDGAQLFNFTTNSNPYAYSVTYSSLVPGNHSWLLNCTNAYNTSVTANRSYIVNGTPNEPSLSDAVFLMFNPDLSGPISYPDESSIYLFNVTYSEGRGRNGTLFAEWYNNALLIENDSVNVSSGNRVEGQLMVGPFSEGDMVSVIIRAESGGVVTENISWAYPNVRASNNDSITCVYHANPTVNEEQIFSCDISNATGKRYECYGLTKNPADGSVLDVMPRQELNNNYTFTSGYVASPVGSASQGVVVRFSNKRLKINVSTDYEVQCVSNATLHAPIKYSQIIHPRESSADLVPGFVIEAGDNGGFIIGGIIMLIAVLLALGVIFWKRP